jgi:F-type H+-transporting ATPase subunit epsilon
MFILRCVLITPEKTVFDRQVEFVALPLEDGEIGIAPGRAPMIAQLACGEMRIRDYGRVERYYVAGGAVEVEGDVVTVLAPEAVRDEEIDESVVRAMLFDAMSQRPATPGEEEHRQEVIRQCRAQLRIARRARKV